MLSLCVAVFRLRAAAACADEDRERRVDDDAERCAKRFWLELELSLKRSSFDAWESVRCRRNGVTPLLSLSYFGAVLES